ncbi:PREDICTED: sphingomyelin phosphodiesterase 2 [Calidris pugnax]|uniref:sphingomyelin phosphodiesterase 2 n=1 Tax=Calidris pugnax TaxID=198806 RepID=UPI00071D04CB|nr:PREDICTED: sphingomyelin phosphodiesterase 2 [Calidris pugnax]XP_014809209.1 PREDICTED: sphingomyelin phosphodiesterase 2 [Calidris pugnax]XP_014809210.1 PREDICTED: sphingomyelin phosphodiesterase 2 [Calidris pugnax]XP_014809211.1 PREDICTED: sphingomyelin phosphodiesterase 2 [Calidris pugnax]
MEGDPTLRLRVFDLNCWAIRYLSKRRQERVQLIGDVLRREGFDLVLLQEVWSEQDYSDLKAKLGSCYPFSHYFRSGVIGSGLCVFSRFPILDTLLYQYSLNGYPYMLQHGDWFGGKSVGLVIVKISGIIFNVYVTHLHAEYCREKDAYLPHRLVQAWELAQFIRHTSKAADVVLVGGDLNMHPEDLGIRLLRGWTGLRDAFAEATHFEGCEDGCTLVPNNCFTVKSELLPFPLGIRIDYILYKAISGFTVKCEELKTTKGTAPGMDIPFSDHEAVMATLQIRRQGQAAGDTQGTAETTLADVVTEARTEVGVGLRAAQGQRYSTGRMAVLALLLLLLQAAAALGTLAGLGAGQPFPKLSFALLAFLAIGVLFLATGLHLFHTMEVKMLQGTEEQMRMALRALQERPSDS